MFRVFLISLFMPAAVVLSPPSQAGDAIGDTMQLAQRGDGNKNLTVAEIRKIVIGNTLRFVAPSNGKTLSVYFGSDGRVVLKPAGGERIVTKKWFINKKSMLCRTLQRQNKKHCTKVKATDTADQLTLFNNKIRYRAALLPGNQVSGKSGNEVAARQGGNTIPGEGANRRPRAGSSPQPPGKVIGSMDKDGDRRVSRQEFRGPPQKFSKMDANQDGFIVAAEIAAFQARQSAGATGGGPGGGQRGGPGGGKPDAATRFAMMDSNRDGKILPSEFRGPKQAFKKIDANGDGFISNNEFATAVAGQGASGPAAGRRGADGPPGRGPARRSGPDPRRMLARFDQNGDGKISSDEWKGNKKGFRNFDLNGDGFIVTAELEDFFSSGASLRAKANNVLKRSEGRSERRTNPKNCRYDGQKYAFKNFVIEGYSPNCAFGGTTLFVDGTDPQWATILEIDMTGRVVWQFNVGNEFGAEQTADHRPFDASRLPNGNTLFGMKFLGAFEVDPGGKVVWKHLDSSISHDVDRLPNGNTLYVRGWSTKGEDQLREVDRDGKLVWSWTGLQDFDGPEFAPIDDPKGPVPGYEGWIHTNAVTRMADGRTLISLLNFSRAVYVNRSGKVVQSFTIAGTHDPEVLENGRILVNFSGPTVIGEVTDRGILWRWDWDKSPQKTSIPEIWRIRDANRLPNGNTLMTSNNRLIEIDAAGEIVWHMVNKKFGIDMGGGNFFKATRIGPDGKAYGG